MSPDFPTAFGVIPTIQAYPPRQRAHYQAVDSAVRVERVAVASQRLGGELRQRYIVHRQTQEDHDGVPEECVRCHDIAFREPSQDHLVTEFVEPSQ